MRAPSSGGFREAREVPPPPSAAMTPGRERGQQGSAPLKACGSPCVSRKGTHRARAAPCRGRRWSGPARKDPGGAWGVSSRLADGTPPGRRALPRSPKLWGVGRGGQPAGTSTPCTPIQRAVMAWGHPGQQWSTCESGQRCGCVTKWAARPVAGGHGGKADLRLCVEGGWELGVHSGLCDPTASRRAFPRVC